MIAAHISSNQPKERAVTMLALTHRECMQLRALLGRILEDVQIDKNSYRVTNPRDPQVGRIIRDQVDITELTFETERIALQFRRRL